MTSRFNTAELFVGIELCNDPIAERRRIDEALENLLILEFDEDCALRYAKIAARLRTMGKPTGIMDLLIASVALGFDQPFLTRNVKHFSNINGLRVVGY
jgi:predicted nucleic acid-binding protein